MVLIFIQKAGLFMLLKKVPAMSNLNGEISGLYFENGRFHVDMVITMYWDTLKKMTDIPTQNTDVSQTVDSTDPAEDDTDNEDKGVSSSDDGSAGLTNVNVESGQQQPSDSADKVSGKDISQVKTGNNVVTSGCVLLMILAAGGAISAVIKKCRQNI